MADYTKKAVRGAGIIFLMTVASYFLGYVFRILLARGFSLNNSGYHPTDIFDYTRHLIAAQGDPSSYGLVYSIISFFGLFSIVMNLGLRAALLKYTAEYKATNQLAKAKGVFIIVSSITFLLSAIICGAIILSSYQIANTYLANYPQDAGLKSALLQIYAVGIIFSSIILALRGILNGFQNMKYYASADLTKSVVSTAITFILLYMGANLMAPMLGFTLTYVFFLPAIYFYVLLRKAFPEFLKIKAEINKPLVQKLFGFGLATTMMDAAQTITGYTDTVILTYFRTPTEVGYYNVASPTLKLLSVVGATIIPVLAPMSCELWATGKKDQLNKGFKLLYKYVLIIILPLVLVVAIYAETIVSVLFGANFAPAGIALRILAIAYLLEIFVSVNSSILACIDHPKEAGKIAVYGSGVNLTANLLLIPVYGIAGAAVSSLLGSAAVLVMSIQKIKKYTSFTLPWRDISVLALSTVLIVASAYAFNVAINDITLRILSTLIVGGLIYGIMLLVSKTLTIEEVVSLARRVR